MPTIGEIVVGLTADTSKFNTSVKAAQDKITSIGKSLTALGAAASVVGVPFGLMAKSALDNADALNKMSQKAGTSVEFLSRLSHAAGLADVEAGKLQTGIVRLSAKIVDAASGSKEAAATFASMGVSVKTSTGQLKTVEQILPELADRFKNTSDGVLKTNAAIDLFGKAGADLIPLLNSGSKGLAEMSAESDRLGQTISKETAQAAENFNDSLVRLQRSVTGIFNTIIASPAIQKFADLMNRAADSVARFAKEHPNIVAIGAAIGALALVLGPALAGIGLMISGIGSLGIVAGATVAVKGLATAFVALGGAVPIAALAAGAVAIYKVVDAYIAMKDAQTAAVEAENRLANTTAVMVKRLKDIGVAVDESRLGDPTYVASLAKMATEMGKLAPPMEGYAKWMAEISKEANQKGIEEQNKRIEELNKRIASIKETFITSLKPAEAMNEELSVLLKNFSKEAIVAVYGQRIHDAATAQLRFGGAVKQSVSELDQMFMRLEMLEQYDAFVREARRVAAEAGAQAVGAIKPPAVTPVNLDDLGLFRDLALPKDMTDGVTRATAAFERFRDQVKAPIPPALTISVTTAADAIGAAEKQAAQLAARIDEYEGLGYNAAQITAILGSDLATAARNAELFETKLDDNTIALIRQNAEIKRGQDEAKRWEQVWTQVLANITTDFARGITDVIFQAKSLPSALADIGKNAGRAFTQAFFAELFNPITQQLASWGRELARTMQNTVMPRLAGAIGLGSILPKAAGAATATGGAVAAGGAGSGIGSSLGAFLTNPVTAIVGGALGGVLLARSLIGRGRESADRFGDQIERPFMGDLSLLLRQFQSQRDSGTLTLATATAFRDDISQLTRQYTVASAEFAALSDSNKKVAEQAEAGKTANFGKDFERIFAELNAAIVPLQKAGGTGIAETGRSFSASNVFSDAVDRLVPAFDRFVDVSRGTTAGAGNTVTVNAPLTVNVAPGVQPNEIFNQWLEHLRTDRGGALTTLNRMLESAGESIATA